MKKYYFVLILLIASFKVSGQFGYGTFGFCDDCYWSIEAGLGVSTISGLEDASAKEGFYIGFHSFIPIDYDKFDLRSGFSYTSAGANVEGFKNPLVIHSLNFPLAFHYRPVKNFQVFAGGEIGSNLFGKLPSNVENPNSLDDFEFMDTFTFLDAGILFGGGLIFFDSLDINVSYLLGMTNISKIEGEDWKKNILRLSVGYTFRDW